MLPQQEDWEYFAEDRIAAVDKIELVDSLKGMIRIVEAMRLSTGLGKNQMERLEKAKGLVAKHEG